MSWRDQAEYQALRTSYAEARGEFAIWIGAGLSEPAKLPLWPQFVKSMTDMALSSISSLEERQAKIQEAKLDEVNFIDDIWRKISIIKGVMGEASFIGAMQSLFQPSDKEIPPPLYDEIWSLPRINNVVSLNIDSFARRSHRKVRPAQDIQSFSGREAPRYAHLLKARKPFIVQLHGLLENPDSWVFTREEIGRLIDNQAYVNFVNAILHSMTCIFVGMSVDDVSVGGFLSSIKNAGSFVGSHYWITSRRDLKTNSWAQAAGLQVIRYDAQSKNGQTDHQTPLRDIFSDLRSFKSVDRIAPVVRSDVQRQSSIPEPREIISREPNEVRILLAGKAADILERNAWDTSSHEYKNFLISYKRAVHMAWFLTDEEPDNMFFDLTVSRKVQSGAFSAVWEAYDASYDRYAIKVLNIVNLEKGPEIDSFRRGVESMSLLTKDDVAGAAPIRSAYELPSSVIMKYVEGPTLTDVVSQKNFKFWTDGIEIAIRISKHLALSHKHPAHVLHRDVRPSNVILPNYFIAKASSEVDPYEIVMLNYDMSWHKFAEGGSIAFGQDDVGFYAPEQLDVVKDVTSQSSLVDVYMYGMTLLYLCLGEQPPRGGSSSIDWLDRLTQMNRLERHTAWKSAAFRLRRLIENATDRKQDRRPVMDVVLARLMAIHDAVRGEKTELTTDLWAEEIMARVADQPYKWYDEENRGETEPRRGRRLSIKADLRRQIVSLEFENLVTESAVRQSVIVTSKDKLNSARQILQSAGWSIATETRSSKGNIILKVSSSLSTLKSDSDSMVEGLSKAHWEVRVD